MSTLIKRKPSAQLKFQTGDDVEFVREVHYITLKVIGSGVEISLVDMETIFTSLSSMAMYKLLSSLMIGIQTLLKFFARLLFVYEQSNNIVRRVIHFIVGGWELHILSRLSMNGTLYNEIVPHAEELIGDHEKACRSTQLWWRESLSLDSTLIVRKLLLNSSCRLS